MRFGKLLPVPSLTIRPSFTGLAAAALAAAGIAISAAPSLGADLPPTTQKMLKQLKLDRGALGDIDKALAVPQAWIDAARREQGGVAIGSTVEAKRFEAMIGPFRERYPWLKLRHTRGSRFSRVIQALIALQEDRIIHDVIMSLGAQADEFRQTGKLAKLSDLPAYAGLDPDMKSSHGYWASMGLLTRCMAYNTKLVKPADVPKTWEDILTNPRWRGAKVGITNRSDYWALHLAASRGVDRTRDYLTRLFRDVKPQLRKEGNNAVLGLLVAGEFDLALVGSTRRGSQYLAKGAPFAMTCADMAPVSVTEVGVIRISPHYYGAMIFTNWLISREGQIAQFAGTGYEPSYNDLRDKGLAPIPGVTKGAKVVFSNFEMQAENQAAVSKLWDEMWNKGSGLKMRTVTAAITASKKGGRLYEFKVGGKTQKVRVSSSRTEVTVAGKRVARKAVKAAMTCKITYPGDGETAKSVACK